MAFCISGDFLFAKLGIFSCNFGLFYFAKNTKDGLTQSEIETAMQAVIDHNIFVAGPNSRLGADIVDRTVTVVFGD
jgi:hypothetical protein